MDRGMVSGMPLSERASSSRSWLLRRHRMGRGHRCWALVLVRVRVLVRVHRRALVREVLERVLSREAARGRVPLLLRWVVRRVVRAAAAVSQPADTMLSKINKTKGLPGEGTTSRLIKIAKELGFRGSYSGIGARLFMVGTLTAGQFAIYGKFLP